MIPFDFPHIRGGGPLGKHGVGNVASKHRHTIVEDVNGYVWLKPVEASTVAVTAETVLGWCVAMGVPRVSMNDTARHFKNQALRLVTEALGTSHRFAVANSPLINATVERMIREVVGTFKAIANKKRCLLTERWLS